MYAKLFEQIYDSSIADNWRTRVVFQDMLILADSNGMVDRTAEAISARTRVPLKMVKDAIKELESPDARSRTSDAGGRRLLRIDDNRDWGWHIVNYEKYRAMRDEFDRKAYMRNYMREVRAVEKVDLLNPVNNQSNMLDGIPSNSPSVKTNGGAGGTTYEAVQIYQLYPRKVGKPAALNKIRKAITAYGYELVRKATERFALAWNGAQDLTYCPHPATWFGQERFNDAPETWERTKGKTLTNTTSPPWAQKKAIEDVLAAHPCNKQSVKHDPNSTPEQKTQYKQLRAKLEELTSQVAMGGK